MINSNKTAPNTYIKDLQVLIVLFHKQLFIELFNEIHFLVSVEQMSEVFQYCAILYWQYL